MIKKMLDRVTSLSAELLASLIVGYIVTMLAVSFFYPLVGVSMFGVAMLGAFWSLVRNIITIHRKWK